MSLTPNAANSNNAAATPSSENKAVIKDGVQTLKLTASASGYTPSTLYVKKGVPVKWEVNGAQLTSCNNTLVIPSLNKKFKLSKGENVFEFTPGDKDLKFSCWMGMINGTIKVVDDLDTGFLLWSSLIFTAKFITNLHNGNNVSRIFRILFYFLSYIFYMYIYSSIIAFKIHSKYFIYKLFS